MEKNIERIKHLEDCLIEEACAHKDDPDYDWKEAIDGIKDLSEAKKNCYEAAYYKSIYEAMKKAEEYPESDRMGYDNYRYASGRFAPTGHGHYAGYTHPMMMDDRYDMDGYTRSGAGNRSQTGSRMGYHDGGRYGDSYEGYRAARRHYTETKSPEHKQEMESHADKHIHESLETIKEIWTDADPELKTRMKNEMTKAINEMK